MSYRALAQRLGYVMPYRNSAQVMDEIARLVPGYAGITYARLERQRRSHANHRRTPTPVHRILRARAQIHAKTHSWSGALQ